MPQKQVARTILKVVSRPERLRDIAFELEAEAHYLRAKAQEIEGRKDYEAKIRRRRRLIRNAAFAVARGADLEREAAHVARCLDGERSASVDDMKAVIATECRRSRAVLLAWRDRELMQFARHGWSNAQLGERFDLHPKSVSRIVQQCLRGKR